MSTDEHELHNQEAEDSIKRIIKEHGWYVALFEADTATPAFAYTIGLWKNFNHPEIIVFGLPTDTMHWMLNDAAELIQKENPITVNADNYNILSEGPVQFRPVESSNIPDYFGYARWFYEYGDFPAVQLVWPDNQARFPWNEGFDERYEFDQPVLDRKLDFKFFEPRNVATFVARQIFSEGRPILYVCHDDDDGSWQFLTGDSVTTDDCMIVALEEVVKHDLTINELFNMPTGQYATRQFVGDQWIRESMNNNDEAE
ncbi:hypothetical protein PK28_04570 [Hymenobacter sp. DG25B]|uniref:DUF4262 domain-containing protein n=1 Tax=Hymenobacter sp. DG25B TaxID=1385664 RepID=UPI000540BD81|nr:DUF4262 domain-containing protein [Hymenobacter sp. DG25B]AIZ63143.1 hypothetical protein PK28_04570 [Hymenobacter sp. DG25B]